MTITAEDVKWMIREAIQEERSRIVNAIRKTHVDEPYHEKLEEYLPRVDQTLSNLADEIEGC